MKNKAKKIIIYSIISIILLALIVLISAYLGSQDFRNWTSKNVLKKEVDDEKLPTVYLDATDNTYTYAYSNYVVILKDNNLDIYNKYGKKVESINIQVSKPKFKSEENYLLIADEGASKLYLVYNNSLQWEKDIDGNIAQITVNKNGAVGVIITGTTYKSVVVMYDITGKEIFKTFLSSTNATDIAISNDSNYLSFIEINTSGVSIISKVKTISVDKAITQPSESIIYTYEMESDTLLARIKYRKNKVVALADNGVFVFDNGNKEKIVDIDSSVSFADIDLDGYVAYIKEETDSYVLNILNVENKKNNTYVLNDAVKNIYCNENITAVDVGNKVDFVNNNAWVIKKFTSHQNIKSIILGTNCATIIYKDRIEILDL